MFDSSSPPQSWWNVIVMADEICRVLLDRPGKGHSMSLIIFFLSRLFQFFSFVYFIIIQKKKGSFILDERISFFFFVCVYPGGMRPWKRCAGFHETQKLRNSFFFLYTGFFCVCVSFTLRCGFCCCCSFVRVFVYFRFSGRGSRKRNKCKPLSRSSCNGPE